MFTFYPNYYQKFKCKADKCIHSCCRDWEIDIDCETLEKYNAVQGQMGDELRSNIASTPEPHFVLTKEGACPFLNENGLCRIILNLGEDHLCDICRLHPRFVLEYLNCREIGVGMCCEAATELILDEPEALYCVIDHGDQDTVATPKLTKWEKSVLKKRQECFDIIFNYRSSISKVRSELLKLIDLDGLSIPFKSLVKILLKAEILDKGWEDTLRYALNARAKKQSVINEQQIRNLIAYFIFRHLSCSEDEFALEENLVFSVVSTDIIVGLCSFYNNDKGVYDICRMYSSEIEYSTTNKDYIMSQIEEFDIKDLKDAF